MPRTATNEMESWSAEDDGGDFDDDEIAPLSPVILLAVNSSKVIFGHKGRTRPTVVLSVTLSYDLAGRAEAAACLLRCAKL